MVDNGAGVRNSLMYLLEIIVSPFHSPSFKIKRPSFAKSCVVAYKQQNAFSFPSFLSKLQYASFSVPIFAHIFSDAYSLIDLPVARCMINPSNCELPL